VDNFSLEAVKPKYEDYFESVRNLTGEGWYTLRDKPIVNKKVFDF
jgi:hypothetical protein